MAPLACQPNTCRRDHVVLQHPGCGIVKVAVFFSMFKPRQAPQSTVSAAPPAIEEVRQRAKHRLIGAGVLVLAGVVVFPLLFDTQPRPIPVDIPIEIPSRQALKPAVKATGAPPDSLGADAALSPREELVAAPVKAAPAPADPKPAQEQAAAPPVQTPVVVPPAPVAKKPVPVSAPAPATAAPNAQESARAQALLEGREASKAVDRFIVQVGAFADVALAQQARWKLERAGMKTYTHVANTPEGKRTRVRLGPFATRAEAEKAAAKAKGVGLAPAILTL
jgi:DedD protein